MKRTERGPAQDSGRLAGKTIILGVTGSIAAYKAVSLARRLVAEGALVHAVMTQTAQRFVGPVTFQVLTGRPVGADLFPGLDRDEGGEQPTEMAHLALAERADLIVVAPATAHCMAKLAHGLADDLLSTLVLASECPLLIAPAMDGGMWDHPAVRENVRALRARNVTVLEPEVGPLASGRVGMGRFPDEEMILTAMLGVLTPRKDFRGRRVLITAGPTQEALDPIRFLSNRSSGKMGWALAEAARDRGADVTLVAGPTSLPKVTQVSFVSVVSSDELRKAVGARFPEADVLMMAAAVADFRPIRPVSAKIPKGTHPLTVTLEPTPDILSELPARRPGQCVVGFAAETGDLIARAHRKLVAKHLDMIVANNVTEVGAGFGTDTNRVTLLDRHGRCEALPLMSKRAAADRILDAVLELMSAGKPRAARPVRGRRRQAKNPEAR